VSLDVLVVLLEMLKSLGDVFFKFGYLGLHNVRKNNCLTSVFLMILLLLNIFGMLRMNLFNN
jgi:hypothetical protein